MSDTPQTEQSVLKEIRLEVQKNILGQVKAANAAGEPLSAAMIGNITNLLKATETHRPDPDIDTSDPLDAELPEWDEEDLNGTA